MRSAPGLHAGGAARSQPLQILRDRLPKVAAPFSRPPPCVVPDAGMSSSPLSRHLLADRFCLREQIQIVRSARFGIGTRHIKTAERMRPDHCSRTLAIDVEISYMEVALGSFNFLARRGVDRAGESVLGVVGDRERIFEVAGFAYRQYRTEDFLLRDPRLRVHIGDD